MKLYHTEWCPECEVVRQKLAEKGIDYEHEIVPDFRMFRTSVHKASGQYYVPVLVDGETVLTETEDIIQHLDSHSHNTSESGVTSNSPPRPAEERSE